MPISVTCACGARLEIDEKFLGKEVPCPDCQRPLPTQAPVQPPPLELPDNRRTSGLAVASLAVGLVGMFTIVGSLAAIGLGVWAARVINRDKKLDGLRLARAGTAVGGVGLALTLLVLITPLGLDALYRELAFAFLGRTTYGLGTTIENAGQDFVVKRPSVGHWGVFVHGTQSSDAPVDDLLVVNIWADAYMAGQHIKDGGLDDDEETIKNKIVERVRKSELVNLIGRLGRAQAPEPANIASKKDKDDREITFDLRLNGRDRRFLVLYKAPAKHAQVVKFFVGCARVSQFERAQEQFREAFTGFVVKN